MNSWTQHMHYYFIFLTDLLIDSKLSDSLFVVIVVVLVLAVIVLLRCVCGGLN